MEYPTAYEILACLLENTCDNFDYTRILAMAEKYMAVCYCDYEISRQGPLVIALCAALAVFDDMKFFEFRDGWV